MAKLRTLQGVDRELTAQERGHNRQKANELQKVLLMTMHDDA